MPLRTPGPGPENRDLSIPGRARQGPLPLASPRDQTPRPGPSPVASPSVLTSALYPSPLGPGGGYLREPPSRSLGLGRGREGRERRRAALRGVGVGETSAASSSGARDGGGAGRGRGPWRLAPARALAPQSGTPQGGLPRRRPRPPRRGRKPLDSGFFLSILPTHRK